MSSSSPTKSEHASQQKLIIFIVVAVAFVFVMLRLNLHPRYNADEFAVYYDDLCEVLREDGDADALYDRAKREFKRTGTQVDVMFFFQFIGIYTDNMPTPKKFEATDAPIRLAVHEARFEEARDFVRTALIESDEMTEGRAKAWGKLIRELEARWDNDCRKPS